MSPIYPAPADGTIYETDDGHGIVVENGTIRMVDPASASVASLPVPAHPLDRRAIVVNLATALGFDPPSLRPNIDVGDRVVVYDPEIDTITAVGHLLAVEDVWAWVLVDDDPQPRNYRLRYIGLEPADAPEAVEGDEGGRCVEGDRLCVPGSDDWCDTPHPAGDVVCSRPPGHDGPHVACDPAGEHTLETWPKTDP